MPQSYFVMPTLYFGIVYWLSGTQFKSAIFNRHLILFYFRTYILYLMCPALCGVYKLESTLLQVAVDVVMDFR